MLCNESKSICPQALRDESELLGSPGTDGARDKNRKSARFEDIT